tara:strand:- start:21572 stop:21829 length:258 start_codon:yes stop_codon:yes gene_type:complete
MFKDFRKFIYSNIHIEDLQFVDFSQVTQTSADTIRKSLDDSQFIISWLTTPTFIEDGTIEPISLMTHAECYELVNTPEWTPEDLM